MTAVERLRRSRVLAEVEGDRGPPPRPPEAWLRCRHARVDSLPPLLAFRLQVDLIVETREGHAYLGRVVPVAGRWALAVVGRERPLRLPPGARIDVVPEHSWAERREVVRRQREGEPGAEIDLARSRRVHGAASSE